MTIPFQTILSSGQIRTNTHHIEFDASRAIQGTGSRPHKVLIMGIKLAAGTLAELIPTRVYSPDVAAGYWGNGSQIAEMFRAFKRKNGVLETWGCAINELSGGTAGTRTITVTGPATAAGTIHLYIDGEHYIPVAVANGDAQNTIASAINTAIQAHGAYGRMPFTTGVATNVVTATQRWKGVDVADIRVNYNDGEALPAGVTVTIAAGVAGAGNPDINSILTAIGDAQYDTIVCPWNDTTNLTALKAELTDRWGGMTQKEGQAWIAHVGTHGAAVTLGNAHNHQNLSIMPANTSPTAQWKWAAVAAACDAGEPLASRPRQGLEMVGCLPPARTAIWTQTERNTLLFEGCSSYIVDDSGTVYTERLTTSYQTNAQGTADPTYLDVETPRTLAAIRYDLRTSVSLAFPRHLLMDDGGDIPLGLPVVTPNTMKAHIIGRFDLWAAEGWVESSSKAQFVEELIVVRPSSSTTRLEADLGPNLMNQFRGLSGKVAFIL